MHSYSEMTEKKMKFATETSKKKDMTEISISTISNNLFYCTNQNERERERERERGGGRKQSITYRRHRHNLRKNNGLRPFYVEKLKEFFTSDLHHAIWTLYMCWQSVTLHPIKQEIVKTLLIDEIKTQCRVVFRS